MSSSGNGISNLITAAQQLVERFGRRHERYDANFRKASQRGLERIGSFLDTEFGTQAINEISAFPKWFTDSAFEYYCASFDTEISALRARDGIKRRIAIGVGLVAIVVGVGTLAAGGLFLVVGGVALFVGFSMVVGAFRAFPQTPSATTGNQDLFLALRCQHVAEELLDRVNQQRANLGLGQRLTLGG